MTMMTLMMTAVMMVMMVVSRLQRGNLGLGFSSLSGFSPSSYETTFVIGLEGIREEDITTTWEMIDTTLQSLASSSTCPFEQSQINGILHQLEISQKHITSLVIPLPLI